MNNPDILVPSEKKKLSLTRETLRTLSNHELGHVVGGTGNDDTTGNSHRGTCTVRTVTNIG